MATIRQYYHPTLFHIPANPKVEKAKPTKFPKIISEKEKRVNKRQYNASYRLRKKIGITAFPKKSKNIFCELGNDALENISEIKLLTKEYGFAVKPLAFPNL